MSLISKIKIIEDLEYPFGNSIWEPHLPGGLRTCDHVTITDDLKLSIQASMTHYCTPRALLPLEKYTHFEMAIILENRLYDFTDLYDTYERKDELLEYKDGVIYNFVPVELLDDFYKWLVKTYE